MNEVFGHISPTPYAIVILRLQLCNPIYSQILYWKWRLQHPQGQEGELSASSREKKREFFLESGNHTGDWSLLI